MNRERLPHFQERLSSWQGGVFILAALQSSLLPTLGAVTHSR